METYTQEKPDWIISRDEGLRCLEQRNYDDAVKALQEPALTDPSGESQALMGLAHYQREEYEQAAHYYEAALKLSPDHADWRDMLEKSRGNATAELNVHVPEIYYFDRAKLLESASPATDPS